MKISRKLTNAVSLVSIFAISAIVVHAQTGAGIASFKNFIDSITSGIIASLGYMFMGAAVVMFIFGVVQTIYHMRTGDTTQIEKGRQFLFWGLVALFVMFSLYGIIRFAQTTLDIRGGGSIDIPTIRIQGTTGIPGGGTPAGSPALNTTPTPGSLIGNKCSISAANSKECGGNDCVYNPEARGYYCVQKNSQSTPAVNLSTTRCSAASAVSSECGGRACVRVVEVNANYCEAANVVFPSVGKRCSTPSAASSDCGGAVCAYVPEARGNFCQ